MTEEDLFYGRAAYASTNPVTRWESVSNRTQECWARSAKAARAAVYVDPVRVLEKHLGELNIPVSYDDAKALYALGARALQEVK